MSTVEVAPEQETTIVSLPSRTRIFAARRSDLRLVMKPTQPIYGAGGMKIGETPGITLAFQQGLLHVPAEGTIVAEKGLEIDAAEVNPWIDAHRLNGDAFEGFFEMIQAAPPVSADELRGMMRLSAALDIEGLEQALAEERGGWNRPDIILPLEESIANIKAATEPATPAKKPKAE